MDKRSLGGDQENTKRGAAAMLCVAGMTPLCFIYLTLCEGSLFLFVNPSERWWLPNFNVIFNRIRANTLVR